jgi:hypothetical protein
MNVLQIPSENLSQELIKAMNMQDWQEHELDLASNILKNL